MPTNKRISEYTALTSPATGDLIPIVDVSDTTDAASGTTKKITLASLKASGSDVDTGTEDVKFTTPKSLADAGVYQAGGTDVAIADGGTGQSSATAAFDALAPTTTQGDIIYHNGTDNVRLAKGTAGQLLTMNSGATAPEWQDIQSVDKVAINTTEISITNGGTIETDQTIFSVSIPANTLSTNNGVRFCVYFSSLGIYSTSENTIFKMKYGATTVATATFTNFDTATNFKGKLSGFLLADGATNAQKGMFEINANTAVGVENSGNASTVLSKAVAWADGSAAEDSTGALNLVITGNYATTNANNDLTAEFIVVEKIV